MLSQPHHLPFPVSAKLYLVWSKAYISIIATSDDSEDGNATTIIIIAVAAGGVTVTLLLLTTSCIVCLVYRKKKRSKVKMWANAVTTVVYLIFCRSMSTKKMMNNTHSTTIQNPGLLVIVMDWAFFIWVYLFAAKRLPLIWQY